MNFVPRPYQALAHDFLTETPRCALWMGCGLGKTATVLSVLNDLALVSDPFPALVLGPLRVARKVWKDEAQKWDEFHGLRVSNVIGTSAERLAALRTKAEIYALNYENLPWLLDQIKGMGASPFKTIVPDEASKLKNFRGSIQHHPKSGKRFIRCDSGQRTGALAKFGFSAARFIELTGTPAPRGLINVWPQLWFLDGGARLGRTFSDFEARWFRQHPSGYGLVPVSGAQEEIQSLVKDVCLTIDPADWFDLQQPIRRVIEVDLPPKARAAYDRMEREMFLQIGGADIEAMNAASKSIKCLQLANGAIYTDDTGAWTETHDEKLQALSDVIEEAEGMPVIVAYQFKSDLARLQKAFPKGRALKSVQDEDDFKAGKIDVLFAHPESAGHGIDGFQYVTNIIAFFGHWWDLETRHQIIERIGPVRQAQAGMKRPVFIYDIVAKDTIDEDVMERHETKRDVQDILLSAMKRKGFIE